jgi:hypothetical protein
MFNSMSFISNFELVKDKVQPRNIYMKTGPINLLKPTYFLKMLMGNFVPINL